MKILNLKKGGKYAELAQVYDQNESSLPETVKKKKKFVLFLLPCLLSLQLVAKVSWAKREITFTVCRYTAESDSR